MASEKISFTRGGITLSGLLELPEGGIKCFALFAHCFTCSKNIAAATHITRALSAQGIAVLRFDFTGLGNSDGDFANTNFSSNMQDLLAASDYLREHWQAPQLLIGHSLGGAAVLAIARDVKEVKAVVSIGAPRDAAHVVKNFSANIAEIEQKGLAEVTLGGRQFTITKQFLQDVENNGEQNLKALDKAALILHSPADGIVPITEAEKIYRALSHPKSFVSLDGADHLLSNKQDAAYVAQLIAAWGARYIDKTDFTPDKPPLENAVVVEEKNHAFTQFVFTKNHTWLADEPENVGGNDSGPDPYAHLLAALGSCTAMTLRMYARHKKLPLEHIRVTLEHSKQHCEDCESADGKGGRLETIHRKLELQGDLSSAQRERLLEIADKCPVHRTLTGNLAIKTELHQG